VGCAYRNSLVKVGGLTYFIGHDGFYRTDGGRAEPIGRGKTDRYFLANVDLNNRNNVRGALDQVARCIYWGFPNLTASSGQPNEIIIYNYEEGRFSHAFLVHEGLTTFGPVPHGTFYSPVVYWKSNFAFDFLKGTPGTALLTTGEMRDPNGNFFRVKGVRPNIQSGTYTVALGTRNAQDTAASYTSEVTANSRSGFCDFRSEARYQRARITLTGTFNSAQGLEVDLALSGAV
jgi:hypothetical protein